VDGLQLLSRDFFFFFFFMFFFSSSFFFSFSFFFFLHWLYNSLWVLAFSASSFQTFLFSASSFQLFTFGSFISLHLILGLPVRQLPIIPFAILEEPMLCVWPNRLIL
jgi:hypothetical protein